MTESFDEIEDPDDSAEYLDLIDSAERYFNSWQCRSDKIDRDFADAEHLRSAANDRQFALLWSNIKTMSPQIYARPPIPVITPKFKDRRPIYRTASEFLERNCIVSFDLDDIDSTMRQLRDDLSISGRGAAWVRYKEEDGEHCTHYEHVDRRDFLHDPARCWKDVAWVARRGWLSRSEMKERFGYDVASEANYQSAPVGNKETYTLATDYREKCPVWEMWHKPTKKVIWVSEGIERVLDKRDPYLDVKGFFPCPEPVYSTVQRGTLIPVPDVTYYADQIAEINDLTRRIHALGNSLQLKGFYQAGGDVGDAIETALEMSDDAKVMVPVSSTAGLVQGGEPIIWLPIDQVSQTLIAAVELRRQLIDDVYQIIGMSDIQRGSTESDETYGAQRIKQQNGSVRLRDKQQALVRLGRDLVVIGAQVIIDNYSRETMIDAAQMDLPTDADVKKNVKALETRAKEQLQSLMDEAEKQAEMAMQQGGQIDPKQVEQAEQQFAQQQNQMLESWSVKIKQASEVVTIDQVMDLLKDERIMPFVLDIETDSTIYPDEQMEKASRIEFMGAFQSAMGVVAQAATMGTEAVALAGGVFKFALAPYRVGRELEGLIDDLVDQAPQIAERMQQAQSGGESQELVAAQNKLAEAEQMKAQAAMASVEAKSAQSQAENDRKMAEIQVKYQDARQKAQAENDKLQLQLADLQSKDNKTQAEINRLTAETAKILASIGLDERKQQLSEYTAANAQQQAQVDTALKVNSDVRADRSQNFSEVQGDRQLTMAEKQSQMKEPT